MSVSLGLTTGRGLVTVQPSYFTSSLFVIPLRNDIAKLIAAFNETYNTHPTDSPFALFKTLWIKQGWSWLHLKILDIPRSRECFLNIVFRLFLEQTVATEPLISRIVGLFGLYTFYMSQPSSSSPPIHIVSHIPVCIDHYDSLLILPSALQAEPSLASFAHHAKYLVSTLVSDAVFYIVPASTLQAQNPRTLPREIFVDGSDTGEPSSRFEVQTKTDGPKRKTGRPSKSDKLQKAKSAAGALDKWLDKSSYPAPDSVTDPAGAANMLEPDNLSWTEGLDSATTHILLSQRPMSSLTSYRGFKSQLLSKLGEIPTPAELPGSLDTGSGSPLARANMQVLTRLRTIDAMAAERGLEVGGEGGDRTALARVERAVTDLGGGGRGILGLLEGGGLQDIPAHVAPASEEGVDDTWCN